jgi:adenosylcobinamide-GDP ribazoletransferase
VTGRAEWMASLILAVRFLTIAPIPGVEATGPGALGRAAWWFPAIGLVLGGGLVLADRGLAALVPPLLSAVLTLAIWKVSTGGMHLDGLADCLDGLGGATPERSLAIMRDSRIGVFGTLGLALDLMIAGAALASIPVSARGPVLLMAPALGRLTPLLIGLVVRAATPGRGLGAEFLAAVSAAAGPTWLAVMLVLGWALNGAAGLGMAAGALIVGTGGVMVLSRRPGGLTGDSLGASVEIAELVFLVMSAADAHST